jgi:hypothetical protein
MGRYKLGLIGLSTAERSLVEILFRLHGVDSSFHWSLAKQPPFDAVLMDAQADEAEFAFSAGRRIPVMKLGPPGVSVDGALSRPIRSDLFIRWLHSIEPDLLADDKSAVAFARTGPPADVVFDDASGQPPGEAAAGLGVDDVLIGFTSGSVTFKLRRWPVPELLMGNIDRIRLVTMLSRRHFGLEELCSLSRVSEATCEQFVAELYQLGLLEAGRQKTQPTAVDANQTQAEAIGRRTPHEASKAMSFGASLIASIRKRFAITT